MGRKKLDKSKNDSKKTGAKKLNMKTVNVITKKAYELSTLCDVPVGVIIYGPNGGPPIVWPEDPERLNKVVDRYLNTPLEERQRRALTPATLSNKSQKRQVVGKVDDKQAVEDLPKAEFQCDGRIDTLSREQLVELAHHLDSKIQLVNNTIDGLKKMGQCWVKLEHQSMMTLSNNNMQVMPSIQHQSQSQSQSHGHGHGHGQGQVLVGNYQGHIMANMKMVNHGEFYNFNHENVNVGNYCYGNSNHNNGITMWDANPLTWYHPHQAQLHQVQAQQFGDHIPFKYD